MIQDTFQLRPRYGEVDQMGYVYHANHVDYCHQARTELLRKYSINDKVLEDNNVMIPVIHFDIDYKKPAHYDELLTVTTRVPRKPAVRMEFEFEICNEKNELISKAKSTVVFVNKETRYPLAAPDFVNEIFNPKTVNA